MKNVFQSIFRMDAGQSLVLPQADKPLLRPLEPRVLLDAAAAETSFDLAERAVLEQQADNYVHGGEPKTSDADSDLSDTIESALAADAVAPPLDRDRRDEIVFVDGSIENLGQIIGSIDQSAEIVILDVSRDGVEQIAETLQGRAGVDAIHIISHGSAGSLSLGSAELTLDSIEGEHADELVIVRDALDINGDILIYGCDFGQGEHGLAAAEALSRATSADIAASDDLTGAESLGGDWDLELQSGAIEARSIEARGFDGVLAGGAQPPANYDANTFDTDGDGIVDANDLDDDNDGITDEDELANYRNGASDATSQLATFTEDTGAFESERGYTEVRDSNGNFVSTVQDLFDADRVLSFDGNFLFFLDDSGDVNRVQINGQILETRTGNFTGGSGGSSLAAAVAQNRLIGVTATWTYVLGTDGTVERYNGATGVYTTGGLTTLNYTSIGGESLATLVADNRIARISTDENLIHVVGVDGVLRAYQLSNAARVSNFDVSSDSFAGLGALSGVTYAEAIQDGRLLGITGNSAVFALDAHERDTGLTGADTDGDGIDDRFDLDSDNDGIADNVEAQTTVGYVAATGNVGSNGIDAAYGSGLNAVDTDGDGAVDAVDTDSDNDGASDAQEAGVGASDAEYNDPNGSINDPANDLSNTFGTAEVDFREQGADTDGDGVLNAVDLDDDNDGILDSIEGTEELVFSTVNLTTLVDRNDATHPAGREDIDLFDQDYFVPTHGIRINHGNVSSGDVQTDFFRVIPHGTGNVAGDDARYINGGGAETDDSTVDIFSAYTTSGEKTTFNEFEIQAERDTAVSTYGGVIFVTVKDITGNTLVARQSVPDGSRYYVTPLSAAQYKALPGNSGISDNQIISTNGRLFHEVSFDGPSTALDFPAASVNNFVNTDVAVVRDSEDLDSDNDGISDYYEAGLSDHQYYIDSNNDGTISANEKNTNNLVDANKDGSISRAESAAVGRDANGNDISSVALTNGGAAGDRDGDGIVDIFDHNVGDITDAGSKGNTPINSDNDSVADYRDLDSDNDGIADTIEARPTANFILNDGDISDNDADEDGVTDVLDGKGGFGGAHANFVVPEDTDGDGLADYLDLDSDNDGVSDEEESGLTLVKRDNNGDGIFDNLGVSYSDPDGAVEAGNTPSEYLKNTEGAIGPNSEVDYRSEQPEAINDTAFTFIDVTINRPAESGLLANDDGGLNSAISITEFQVDTNGDGTLETFSLSSGSATATLADSSGAAIGVITINDDGSYSFDPAATFLGQVPTITYTIANTSGIEASADFNITVRDADDTDGDGIIDPLDIDDDNDGIIDRNEQGDIVEPIEQNVGRWVTHGEWNFFAANNTVTNINDQARENEDFITTSVDLSNVISDLDLNLEVGANNFNHLESSGQSADITLSINGVDYVKLVNLSNDNNRVQVTALNGATVDISELIIGNTSSSNITFYDIGLSVPFASDWDDAVEFRWRMNSTGDDFRIGATSFRDTGVSRIELDTDGAGVVNHHDLDSDNDGISDLREALGHQDSGALTQLSKDQLAADQDGNGTVSLLESKNAGFYLSATGERINYTAAQLADANFDGDVDNDGLMDIFDRDITDATQDASLGNAPEDSDGDTILNVMDLDSDGDGIADTIEGRPTANFITNDGDISDDDVDRDGIANHLDGFVGFGASGANESEYFDTPVDTDGDGIADYLDLDSDNDNITDAAEGVLSGIANNVTYSDPDGAVSASNGLLNVLKDEVGGNEQVAFREFTDTDGDGTPDGFDIDDDNDGILDINEQTVYAYGGRLMETERAETFGPYNQTAPSSVDVNFTGPQGNIDNENIGATQTYNFDLPISDVSLGIRSFHGGARYGNFTVTYADGTVEENVAFTVKDPADYTAEEASLVGNATDGDTNTGAPLELEVDANGNNVVKRGESADSALQGSGVLLFSTDPSRLVTSISFSNLSDPSTAINSATRVNIYGRPTLIDRDQDGVQDKSDLDSDNDGISDAYESGFVAAEQARLQAIIDDDAASAADKNTATNKLSELSEIFADGTVTEAESSDYLSIGEATTIAGDADDDGLMDIFDQDISSGDEAASVGTVAVDSDNDNLADFIDLDSDGDGIADAIEGRPTANFDANDGSNADTDGDGILDLYDVDGAGVVNGFGSAHTTFNQPVDTDGDGTADYLDLDSDDDEITDAAESGFTLSGTDANSDGIDDVASIGATYANPDGVVSTTNSPSAALQNTIGDDGANSEVDYREVRQPPTIKFPPSSSDNPLDASEDVGFAFTQTDDEDRRIIISDPDGGAGNETYTVTFTKPAHGTLTATGAGVSTNATTGLLTITGSLDAVNTALATLVYTGDTDYYHDADPDNNAATINPESDSFTMTVSDGLNADGTADTTPDVSQEMFVALAPEVDVANDTVSIKELASNVQFNVLDGGNVTATNNTDVISSTLGVDNFEGGVTGGVATSDGDTITKINGVALSAGDNTIHLDANGDTVAATSLDRVATIVVNPDGTITYDTDKVGFSGTIDFTYAANTAEGREETATVTINVNDKPAINNPFDAPLQTHEDGEDGLAPANGIYPISGLSISDEDGNVAGTLELSKPAHGVIAVDLTGTSVQNTGTGGNITLVGTFSEINQVLETLTFKPDTDYHTGAVEGSTANPLDKIDITLTDNFGDVSTSSIDVAINSVEDAKDDPLSTFQGKDVTFNVLTGEHDLAIADDFEGTPATVTEINGVALPANGEITLTNGTLSVNANGEITFSPSDPAFVGLVSFTYTAETPDGTQEVANVELFVKKINEPRPPVITPGNPVDMIEDNGPYTISGLQLTDPQAVDVPVEVNLTKPEHADIAVDLTAGGALNAGDVVQTVGTDGTLTLTGDLDNVNLVLATLNVTPDSDYHTGSFENGVDIPVEEIVVTATNTETGLTSAPVTLAIDITPEQDAHDDVVKYVPGTPSTFNILTGTGTTNEQADDFEGTTTTITHINGAPLVPGDAITLVDDQGVTMGSITVAADGATTYTPAENYEGEGTFTYTATTADGIAETATVHLSDADVMPPKPPMIDNPFDPSSGGSPLSISEDLVNEGGTTVAIEGVSITDADDMGETITVTLTQPQNGVIDVDLAAGTDVVRLNNGFGSVQNVVLQGSLEEINKVLATLTFDPDADFHTGAELGGGDIATQQIVISVQDATGQEAEPSTVHVDITPIVDVNADTLTVPQLGSLSFNPVTAMTGGAADGASADSFEGMDVTIVAINGVGPDPIPGEPKPVIPVTANGQPVSATNPAVGTVTSDAQGNMVFTSTDDDHIGTAIFTYIANSKDGIAEETTVTFNITDNNTSPTANDDSVTIDENETATGNVIAGGTDSAGKDTDPENDTLTVTKVNGQAADVGTEVQLVDGNNDDTGKITINSDGSYTFNPGNDFDYLQVGETVTVTIPYEITDSEKEDTANLILTIEGSNDAPSVVNPDGTIGVPGEGGSAVDPTDPMSPAPISPSDPNNTGDRLPNYMGQDGDNLGTGFSIANNFSDVDHDDSTLVYSFADNPEGLSISPNGVISGVLAADASQDGNTGVPGRYLITVTATDPLGSTVTDQFYYFVTNPGPDAIDDTDSYTEDELATGNVITGTETTTNPIGRDVDEDAIRVTQYQIGDTVVPVSNVENTDGSFTAASHDIVVDGTAIGTFTMDRNGEYTFDPADNYNGAVPEISYTITDDEGGEDTAVLRFDDGIDVNDAPIANDDRDGYEEDSQATGNVITGVDTTTSPTGTGVDSDVDGDTLTVTRFEIDGVTVLVPETGVGSHVIPNVGTFTMDSSGEYTFDPVSNYTGSVPPITYFIDDGSGESNSTDSAVLSIFNTGQVNDPPVAVNDTATVDENETATGNVAGNDTDIDGDTLMVSKVGTNAGSTAAANVGEAVAGDNGGSFTVNEDGTWTFDPGTDFDDMQEGDADKVTKITYEISDGNGGFDTAEVIVTVTGSNDAPSVLIVDPNNPEGELIPGGPGVPGAPGTDDPNDRLGNESTEDGTTIEAIDVTGNFTDIDDPDTSLTYSAANLPEGLTISPEGQITGTVSPDASQGGPNEDGVYTVTVTAQDPHGETVTDTFTYTVTNPAPTANDDTDTVAEDGTATGNVITGVGTTTSPEGSGTDVDPDGDDLSVTQISIDGTTVDVPQTGETVSQIIPGVGEFTIDKNGNYTFEPEENYNGEVPEIGYTLDDGEGGTDTATLTLAIDAVNDAPEANPDRDVFTLNTPATGNVLTGVGTTTGDAGQDSDADGDPLTVSQFEVGGVIIDVPQDGSTGTHMIDGVGTIAIDQNGNYTFTPVDGYTGDVPPISYTVTDGTDSAVSTLSIFNDDGVNEDPLANDDMVSIGENDTISGNALSNDTDPDGDGLTITEVNGSTGNVNAAGAASPTTVAGSNGGTFTVFDDGTWEFDPGTDFDSLGVDADGVAETATTQVSYLVSDGNGGTSTANIIVELTGENDAPSIIDPETGEPGEPGTTGTPGTDDPADLLGNQSGNDGETITPIDVKPNFGDVDDNDANDNEAGDDLTYTATGLPEGLTIDENGVITGTIDPDASQGGPNKDGVYTVTVTATDPNGEIVTDSFTYDVNNPDPIANPDRDTFVEDEEATGNVLTGADTSSGTAGADTDGAPDGDLLSVTQFMVGGETIEVPQTGIPVSHTIPDVGTITFDSDGNYTFDPVDDYDQDVPQITYTISDNNGGAATSTLDIAAEAVNDAPVAQNDVDTYAPGSDATGNVITGADTVSGDAGIDSDVEGDPLSVTEFQVGDGPAISVPAGGSGSTTIDGVGMVTMNSDGSYVFTPEAGFTGEVPVITYTVSDGSLSDQAELQIVAEGTPINQLPVAENDEVTIQEGDSGVPDGLNVLTNDSDPDADDTLMVTEVDGMPVTAAGTTVPGDNGGSFTLHEDGTWTFDPGTDFNGLAEGEVETTKVTYTISDGNGGEDTAEIIVSIDGDNAAPSIIDPETGEPGEPGTDGTPSTSTSVGTGEENTTGDLLPNRAGLDGDAIDPFDVSANFDDIDSDDNSSTLVYSAANLPEGLSISDDGIIVGVLSPNASIGGDDPVNAPGQYTVEIIATDSHGEAVTDSFTYTVTNPSPEANDDRVTVTEDVVATGNVITGSGTNLAADGSPILDADGNPTGQDSDPDGDTITVTQFEVAGTTVTVPANGSASHLIDGVGTIEMSSDGSFEFTPETNYNGAVPDITYTIADGQNDAAGNPSTSTAMLIIGDIVDVNDAPVAKNDVDQFIEDTQATGNVISGLDTLAGSQGDLGVDTDVDNDVLMVTQFQVADNPAIVVPEGGSGTFDIPDIGVFTMNSDGSYTFDPVTDFNGQIPLISYTISDGELTDEAELRFQDGIDRNDPPVANDDEATTTEDDVFNSGVEAGALANDTDPENDSLTVVKLNGQDVPAEGITIDGSNGGTFTILPDGSWSFDPDGDFEGLAGELVDEDEPSNNRDAETAISTITYEIADVNGGESQPATISVTVSGKNDAPSVIDPETGLPGTPPGVDGTPSTTDPVGSNEENTTGDALPNRAGVDGDTITPFSVTSNFGDVDSDDTGTTLVYSIINPPRGLSISSDGTISGTFLSDASQGGANSDGIYEVVIVATDSHGESVRDTFTYQVTNPGPNANDDAVVVTEDEVASGNVISGSGTNIADDGSPLLDSDGNPIGQDSDPDGDTLTVTQFEVAGTTVTVPANGSASHLIDGVGTIEMSSDGSFEFTPLPNYNGAVPDITYTIADGQNGADGLPTTSTAQLIMGDIVDVNDALDANDDAVTIDEGSTATLNLLANDTDIDGDELAVSEVIIDGQVIALGVPTEIAGGTITVGENGDVVFVPDTNFAGTISGAYTATDGTAFDQAGFVINVNDVAEPPVPPTPPGPEEPTPEEPREPIDPLFASVEKEVIKKTVQQIQDLNRAEETAFSQTTVPVFNLANAEGLLGDYIAIDIGQFDGDTLIAEGLITENDIQTANNDENVLKLFVNTYVRQNTLYIDIANNQTNLDKNVVKNYSIASLDGSELPSWIRMARDGFVIAETPANVTVVDMMITAELEDGSKIDRIISIDSLSGIINMAEIQPEEEGEVEAENAEGLSDQIKSEVNADNDQNLL